MHCSCHPIHVQRTSQTMNIFPHIGWTEIRATTCSGTCIRPSLSTDFSLGDLCRCIFRSVKTYVLAIPKPVELVSLIPEEFTGTTVLKVGVNAELDNRVRVRVRVKPDVVAFQSRVEVSVKVDVHVHVHLNVNITFNVNDHVHVYDRARAHVPIRLNFIRVTKKNFTNTCCCGKAPTLQ